MASSNFFNPKSNQNNLKKGFVKFNDPGDKPILGPFPSPTPSPSLYPNIVMNGLVLWLDGSFYTSGDWISLVGTDIAVLTNDGGTVTKESNNGGVVQSTGLSEDGFLVDKNYTGDYTVMTATKYMPGGVNGYQGRIVSAYYNNWLLGNWDGNINQYYAQGWISNPDAKDNIDWNIYTGTRNGANYYTFYNGITLVDANFNGSQGPNGLGIFQHAYQDEVCYGQCGFVLVYDRVLTSTEITQNYNAYKSRYGLS
jgi:hypothetical protein